MGRGFGITAAVGHDVVRELAPKVEALGYTSFWVNDMPGADGLASLGVALAVTSDIDLGVGVIPLDRGWTSTSDQHFSRCGYAPRFSLLGWARLVASPPTASGRGTRTTDHDTGACI